MTEFVERPTTHGNQKHDYAAICATADNGKAVEIACPKANRTGASSNLSARVAQRGFRLRTHYDNERQVLIVWCEHRNGATPDTDRPGR